MFPSEATKGAKGPDGARRSDPGTMHTLCDILDRLRADDRDELLWVRPAPDREFVAWSARRFLAAVDGCAEGLRQRGFGRGDRLGLISANRPEWHVLDFACYRLGAALVPLFATLSDEQVAYCLGGAGCRAIVVDTAEQLGNAERAAAQEAVEWVALVDGEPPAQIGGKPVHAFATLIEEVDSAARFPGPEGPDALATIIYTSGTTGPPKGVMLTHRNFVANIEGTLARTPATVGDLGLSLLPLNHVYERTIDYCYLAAGSRVAYSAPDRLSVDFRTIRPTVLIGVPRLYEKLRGAIEARIEGARAIDRAVYRRARKVALRRARARHGLESDGLLNRLQHALYDYLVLDKIRDVMGGEVRMLSAGGAALDPELNWWYAAMGWELLQGYGLTETSPIVSTNALGDNQIGSVGRPLHNVEVKIADDGEVLVRGPSVTPGYWKDPEATAAAFVDGWLATGDIGELDDTGLLRITDRKKSLLVTSTGKNVAPQPIENALLNSPYVGQVMLVGDDRRFIAALIVPDFERLAAWCTERGLDTDPARMCAHADVAELFDAELVARQTRFARYERARAYRLLLDPFTVENGQLTPTLKTVRAAVASAHEAVIEEIYAD